MANCQITFEPIFFGESPAHRIHLSARRYGRMLLEANESYIVWQLHVPV